MGSFAQVSDDFSDGNFTSDPAWMGSRDNFIVNESGELQLNASSAGTSFLYVDFFPAPGRAIEWSLYIKLSFSPSGGNFSRLYLLSDQPDLSGPLNGYYLQFGEPGSEDAIELFRQTGTNRTSLCRATTATIGGPFALRVKVRYQPDGHWYLYLDHSGEQNYVLESDATDARTLPGGYCGLLCTYTISNARRFYFDDFVILETELPDTTPPLVSSVEAIDAKTLKVVFTEPPDPSSVLPENFRTNTQQAIASTLDGTSAVLLSFANSFPNGEADVVYIENIKDLSGNVLSPVDIPFLYLKEHPVVYRDVIVTEIMSKPNDSGLLPESEFLELYNRSDVPVNLSDWVLSDPTTDALLPFFILLPGRHLIIVPSAVRNDFLKYGQVLALTRFPTLNNNGDIITLRSDDGITIDSLSYSTKWYRDPEKADGGWSLELIDPEDICSEHENWTASEAPEGGTPGRQNSVFASRPDNRGPGIVSLVPQGSTTLLVTFNEKLDRVAPSVGEFAVDGGLMITDVAFADATLTKLLLTVSPSIQPGRTYTLKLSAVYDCFGNRISSQDAERSFVFPQRAVAGDIVVNEVLFNPRPGGVDFVEIYNRSEKVIDLREWCLRNVNSSSAKKYPIRNENLLTFPGQYYVFTGDVEILKNEYVKGVEEAFVETEIPALNDDEGFVVLLDHDGTMIDSMAYNAGVHTPFIKDDEGVSLERISALAEGHDVSNWKSASGDSGFATPGYRNSNAKPDIQTGDGSIVVDPELIQPFVAPNDFARINYHFTRGGLIANVTIYDNQGRAVRTIARNELLGTQGSFRWDGDTDNGGLVPTGYYMVWFEAFDSQGMLKTFRKRIAVF